MNIESFELNGIFDDAPDIAILDGLSDVDEVMPAEDKGRVVQFKRS